MTVKMENWAPNSAGSEERFAFPSEDVAVKVRFSSSHLVGFLKIFPHIAAQANQVGALAGEDQHQKWLVPSNELSEDAVKRNFDPDVIGASVVPSPMRGIK